MPKHWTRAATALFATAILTACGGGGETGEKAAEAPAAQQPATGTHGMGGMQGMEGMQAQGGGASEQMQAHMRMMHGATGERMKTMLPEHRQMAANMIAGFNQEMKGMNMATDAAWSATVDSLRQDLVRMPEMGADELQAFMPAHEARLNRLMEAHRAMMSNMKM